MFQTGYKVHPAGLRADGGDDGVLRGPGHEAPLRLLRDPRARDED